MTDAEKDALNALLLTAAVNLLKKLGNMTTLEFTTGADYAEREALWEAVEAAQAQGV